MKKAKGFTLIELMVVIAIIGVLMAMAGPAFGDFIKRQKIRSILNEWQSSFFFAQREAMRLKRPLRMCASSDGETCSNPNGQYSQGWIIFDDKQKTANNKRKVLQDVVMSEKDGLVMRLDGYDYFKNNGFRFLSNGRIEMPIGDSNVSYLVICSTRDVRTIEECNKNKAFDKKVYVITPTGRLTGKQLN